MNRRSFIVHGAGSIALALTCSFLTAAATDATQSLAAGLSGTWIENEAKQNVAGFPPLRFQKNSSGELNELRGPEAAPLSEPVHFDGKQYRVIGGNSTIAWKQTGPNRFERKSYLQGKPAMMRRIEISADGRTLIEVMEFALAEKPLTVTNTYSRVTGTGDSLEGRWNIESRRSSPPPEMRIQATGPNSIRESFSDGRNFTATLDGTPAEMKGSGTIPGNTIAMKPGNEHTIETIYNRHGVATGKGTWTLSPDGKTLTISRTEVGPGSSGAPSIEVYEKQ